MEIRKPYKGRRFVEYHVAAPHGNNRALVQ
jgi:hypothetical protein